MHVVKRYNILLMRKVKENVFTKTTLGVYTGENSFGRAMLDMEKFAQEYSPIFDLEDQAGIYCEDASFEAELPTEDVFTPF